MRPAEGTANPNVKTSTLMEIFFNCLEFFEKKFQNIPNKLKVIPNDHQKSVRPSLK